MALIHFWTWLFAIMGVALPYGWAWLLSQAVFIVLLCLVLMLSVAAVILADRKIWAAVQMRRGPNVVGPSACCRPSPTRSNSCFKEVIIPAGANKVLFLLAPLVSVMLAFIAWAVIPFNKGWVIVRHQCRHPLSLRDVLARRLWHHHGGLGVEFEIRLPVGAARARPRWCPTKSPSAL